MNHIRHAFAVALSLAAIAAFTPLNLIGDAMAQGTKTQDTKTQDAKSQDAKAQGATAALVTKPVALPDMALGSAKARVTIVEYVSMSCPHCAAFEENVFPMLRSKYIDTGKVRFVFRDYPIDLTALGASMLARCIAKDDAEKYFGTVQLLFKQQDQLIVQALDTLQRVGKQAGMSAEAVEACVKNQTFLDKFSADRKFAIETLNVTVTPTFFINGEMVKGAMTFEELDATLKSLLKH